MTNNNAHPVPAHHGTPHHTHAHVQAARFESRYAEILETARAAFADTSEDFASIGMVKKRLEEWKSRWGGRVREGKGVRVTSQALLRRFSFTCLHSYDLAAGGWMSGQFG
jgi:hypothetical protein